MQARVARIWEVREWGWVRRPPLTRPSASTHSRNESTKNATDSPLLVAGNGGRPDRPVPSQSTA